MGISKWLIANATNITNQIKKLKKGHTPSITTVNITVYLKENGNKKKKKKKLEIIYNRRSTKQEAPSKLGLGLKYTAS